MSKITFGQKCADYIAEFGGSWKFIFTAVVFLAVWMIFNTHSIHAFDKPPFIGLNLILSCVAAFQAPFILMSSNRQAEIDRQKLEKDIKINQHAEKEIHALHAKIDKLIEDLSKKD